MGPKKGRRNLKRPKTAEVAKRPNGPADSLDNPEGAPTEAQSSISGTTGSNEPFPGAGHRLGEGRGHSQSLPVHRWRYSVRPAASYLLFPQTQIKWPRISEGTQVLNNVNQVESSAEKTEFLEPVDRKPLVYHMDARGEQNTDAGEEDLPEDFFQVTAEDIKKRYAQLQTDRRALDEAPLLTSALREDNVIKQMQRYPKVVIRVCFPDRHVLQGLFRPLETVGNLKQFVRNHLVDPQIQFSLCGAPGTLRMDDPGATLYEANLFPTALLYFSSGSQSAASRGHTPHHTPHLFRKGLFRSPRPRRRRPISRGQRQTAGGLRRSRLAPHASALTPLPGCAPGQWAQRTGAYPSGSSCQEKNEDLFLRKVAFSVGVEHFHLQKFK
ncbi:tether containing UBX domain for GLUT4-like isoform X4 [Alosa sapidissima]|uniref:tether containing UBX domain for GLUT4-like isoform X4 n=1 Tax=Alosa sapidissima TaxID=34773 RepID=UPI001C0997F6|nr:tether containing UBX domain for GLUT4-like isoform X4 [Alosa sapidissima]